MTESGDLSVNHAFILFFLDNLLQSKNIFITLRKINLINIYIIMKNLVENIAAQYESFATNAALQVEKNNKAAGTRARKAALELTKLLKEFRKVSVEEAKK